MIARFLDALRFLGACLAVAAVCLLHDHLRSLGGSWTGVRWEDRPPRRKGGERRR